ncbi:MAG TPA: hypothetical protein VGM91_19400 [Conexibacter sp.]
MNARIMWQLAFLLAALTFLGGFAVGRLTDASSDPSTQHASAATDALPLGEDVAPTRCTVYRSATNVAVTFTANGPESLCEEVIAGDAQAGVLWSYQERRDTTTARGAACYLTHPSGARAEVDDSGGQSYGLDFCAGLVGEGWVEGPLPETAAVP